MSQDWNNVTLGELWEALQEVEWRAPRPISEFLSPSSFILPKSGQKWNSRIKNNLYYYRSNYLLLFLISFILCLLRNPVALLAIGVTGFGLMCLNDPFATWANDNMLWVVKRLNTRTAMRLRAMANANHDGNLGIRRRAKQRMFLLWLPRNLAVLLIVGLGALLIRWSSALLTLAWVMLLGLGLPLLHATLRAPNLKARLATAKEEFRAVWRGYQQGLQGGHDYTQ